MYSEAGLEKSTFEVSKQSKIRRLNWVALGLLALAAPLTLAWIVFLSWSAIDLLNWMIG